MPEEIVSERAAASESVAVAESAAANSPAVAFESPPAAQLPERREFDPRARLNELALELVRTQNRRFLIEYLRMRRLK
jgi:hypothetical protein